MPHYILFDDQHWNKFLPLTYTRSISNLRCGILTLNEKWDLLLKTTVSILTQEYLQTLYQLDENQKDFIYINSRILPNKEFVKKIASLPQDEMLISTDGQTLAFKSNKFIAINDVLDHNLPKKTSDIEVTLLNNYWDLFKCNHQEIQSDFMLITEARESQPIPSHVQCLNPENIFIEAGAQLDMCSLNATKGFIYIGTNAHIMDGALIRGSAAICDHAVIKMGAKIYEHSTIGPHCKVGGEISNVIFHSYSNKGHDGYLGNALIGAWCNLGADTNCSNLKNDYSSIQVWSEAENKKINTGEQFVGLMMGDHSKCAINTMFNTGTIIGICSNVFGAGFPPTFIPSFSWGWSEKMITHKFEKAIDANNRMMERRQLNLTDQDVEILKFVYNFTQYQRK